MPSVLPQVIPGQAMWSGKTPGPNNYTIHTATFTTAMLCHGNSTLAVVVALVWAKGCILFGCVHVCIWRGREQEGRHRDLSAQYLLDSSV